MLPRCPSRGSWNDDTRGPHHSVKLLHTCSQASDSIRHTPLPFPSTATRSGALTRVKGTMFTYLRKGRTLATTTQ